MVAFFFIASTSLFASENLTNFLNKDRKLKNVIVEAAVLGEKSEGEVLPKDLPPVPSLDYQASPIYFTAESVLAIDLKSGAVLFEKNPDAQLLPASTTKIMTALVALDVYSLDDILRVEALQAQGQKMGLVDGEELSVRDLLYGLLVYSANDAGEVLATNYPGGRDAFVEAMNAKAMAFHLENTNFTNPTGLDQDGQVTTARDLVRIATIAMDDPFFAQVVRTKDFVAVSSDGQVKHRLVNINELVGQVDGVLGVKTGWTENARENLVTFVSRDTKDVMIALLGSQDRFGETKALIDWVFANYSWEEISAL